MTTATVKKIIEDHRYDDAMLIAILQDLQKVYNYLPKEAIKEVAQRFQIPLTRVYGIATFYKNFSLKPRGRHIVGVCVGTACHVKGAARLTDGLKRELGIEVGDSTEDLRFTLETVRCIGCCSLSPVIRVGDDTYGKINLSQTKRVLKKYK